MNGECIYDLIDDNEKNTWGNNGSYQFSNKYEICMFNYVVYTCRLRVCDMFDEMSVMASTGLIKGLFK